MKQQLIISHLRNNLRTSVPSRLKDLQPMATDNISTKELESMCHKLEILQQFFTNQLIIRENAAMEYATIQELSIRKKITKALHQGKINLSLK